MPTSVGCVGCVPTIDSRRVEVTCKGKPVQLSLTQYWMVLALATTQPKPKTAEELMETANISVASNTVVAHIRAIRGRFTGVDPEFEAIRTERGHGYRWVP